MVKPERVLVATVAENRELAILEVEYLFRTLHQFGGSLSRARRAAYFVGSVDPTVAQRLAKLEVAIKIVEPVDQRCPHANKIRMLDDTEDFDYLVALDTDVVIAKDFSIHLGGSSIGAKPVDHDPLTLEQWEVLFSYFDVEFPLARYMTSIEMTETVPYFNSGVLLVSKQHVAPLRQSWLSFIYKLLDTYGELPNIRKHEFYTDQFALSLALVNARLPYRGLPLEMNFPIHHSVHAALGPERLSPYIIHHHHRLSWAGEILPCSYTTINTLVDEINTYLHITETEAVETLLPLEGNTKWPAAPDDVFRPFEGTWWSRIYHVIQEVTSLIPPGDMFILVDEDQWETSEDIAGRRRLPFLERDGQYWGPPPDDETAIRELERLRQAGATFIVFGWPAFWWLDYYAGLHHHLRSEYRCVLENDRLVVFSLRP